MARRSGSPVKLYRKMFADVDGKPLVGDGRNLLGVRPADPNQPRKASDVSAVAGTDKVLPGEGLSAYADPAEIPPQVRGELWVLETGDLPSELQAPHRGKNQRHYQLEPAIEVTLDELQRMLANTRDLWRREGGTNP